MKGFESGGQRPVRSVCNSPGKSCNQNICHVVAVQKEIGYHSGYCDGHHMQCHHSNHGHEMTCFLGVERLDLVVKDWD